MWFRESNFRAQNLAVALLLIGLSFLAYGETLNYWFVAPDSIPLIYTSQFHSLSGFLGIFMRSTFHSVPFPSTWYRPVASTSYGLGYLLWGTDPWGYHFVNVLLHGLTAVFVFLLARQWTDRRPSLVAAVLFVLHPMGIELVPALPRRQDILVTFFVLIAILAFVRSHRDAYATGRYQVYSLTASVLALGSKETGVVLLGLILAYSFIQQQTHVGLVRRVYRTALDAAPYAAVVAGYFVVRVLAVGHLLSNNATSPRLQDLLGAPILYILGLFYPFDFLGSVLTEMPFAVVVLLAFGAEITLGRWVWMNRHRIRPTVSLVLAGVISLSLAGIPAYLLVESRVAPQLAPIFMGDFPVVYALLRLRWLIVGTFILSIVASTLLLSGLYEHGRIDVQSLFTREDVRFQGFLFAWLLGPIALFVVAGGYAPWRGYVGLPPACLLLAIHLDPVLQRLSKWFSSQTKSQMHLETPNGKTLVLGVLIVLLAVGSPLFWSSGWAITGDINRMTHNEVLEQAEGTPQDIELVVSDTPRGILSQLDQVRKAQVSYSAPRSFIAWLRLHGHGNDVQVPNTVVLEDTPTTVCSDMQRNNGELHVNLRYTNCT